MELKTIVKRSIRLFKTASGPTQDEYNRIVKITLTLALALGITGLAIHFILNLV